MPLGLKATSFRLLDRRIWPRELHLRHRVKAKKYVSSIASQARIESLDNDWNKHDDFFTFTRGRFVVDESSQMEQRRVRFNMNELVRVAAKCIGSRRCVSVTKYPDGMYNKSFLLTMDDGREVVAKIPNPNAGIPHFTTASEVATMDFARNVLNTPVPQVHAWSSRAEHPVGTEYIIMEKVPGVQLSQVWMDMKIAQRMQLRLNLALHQEKWAAVTFRDIGALYYAQDLPSRSSEEYLYMHQGVKKIHDSRFGIGPSNGRDWTDCGRAELKCDRGPWRTSSEYRRAVGQRELSAISSLKAFPRQTVMVCGPGLYCPEIAKKTAAVKSYLRVFEALLPDDPLINSPILWHDDLHEENIFVDLQDPTKVVGVIDWQSSDLLPMYDHNPDPAFIKYSSSKPDSLDRPKLPDTTTMSKEDHANAIKDYYDKSLFIASRKIASKKTPAMYQVIEYQDTEAFDLVTIARRIFEFGEAHFHSMTVDLRDAWPNLPWVTNSSTPQPFPLMFDNKRLKEIAEDIESAMIGVTIMNDLKASLGPLWPDKDAVSHEQYDETKAALRKAKEQLIAEFAKSEDDRLEFLRLWPFDD